MTENQTPPQPAETPNIKDFINALVQEKGFADVKDPEVMAQLKQDLEASLNERVGTVLLTSLPDDKRVEAERLITEKKDDQLPDYLAANIPDLPEKLAQIMLDFRREYVAD